MGICGIHEMEGIPEGVMWTELTINDFSVYVKDVIYFEGKKRECRICVVEV